MNRESFVILRGCMKAPKNEPLATIVRLPFADVADVTVKRKRGRPRKVALSPVVSEDQYGEELRRARERALAADPLLAALEAGHTGAEAMNAVKVAMAGEVAALGFVRRQQEARGQDISQLASRRVAALSMLANMTFEISKLGGEGVDLRSDRVGALLTAFTKEVEGVAEATLPAEVAEPLVDGFRRAVEGWEERIRLG